MLFSNQFVTRLRIGGSIPLSEKHSFHPEKLDSNVLWFVTVIRRGRTGLFRRYPYFLCIVYAKRDGQVLWYQPRLSLAAPAGSKTLVECSFFCSCELKLKSWTVKLKRKRKGKERREVEIGISDANPFWNSGSWSPISLNFHCRRRGWTSFLQHLSTQSTSCFSTSLQVAKMG